MDDSDFDRALANFDTHLGQMRTKYQSPAQTPGAGIPQSPSGIPSGDQRALQAFIGSPSAATGQAGGQPQAPAPSAAYPGIVNGGGGTADILRAMMEGRKQSNALAMLMRIGGTEGAAKSSPKDDADNDSLAQRFNDYLKESGRSLYEGPRNMLENFIRDAGPGTLEGASGGASTLLSAPVRAVTGGRAGFGTAVDAIMNPLYNPGAYLSSKVSGKPYEPWGTRAEDFYDPLESRFLTENEGVVRPIASTLEALGSHPYGMGAAAEGAAAKGSGTANTIRQAVESATPGSDQLSAIISAKTAAQHPFFGPEIERQLAEARVRRNIRPSDPDAGAGDNYNIFQATQGTIPGGKGYPSIKTPGIYYGPEGQPKMEVPAGNLDASVIKPGNSMPLGKAYSSEVFQYYPDLASKRVRFTTERTGGSPKNIETKPGDPDDFEISLYNRDNPNVTDWSLVKANIEKRLQYMIQDKEGFAAGAQHKPGEEFGKLDATLNKTNAALSQGDLSPVEATALREYRDHLRSYHDDVQDARVATNPGESKVLDTWAKNQNIDNAKKNRRPVSFPLSQREVEDAVSDHLYDNSAGRMEADIVKDRRDWPGAGIDYPLAQGKSYPVVTAPGSKPRSVTPDIGGIKNALVLPPRGSTSQDLIEFAKNWYLYGNGRASR